MDSLKLTVDGLQARITKHRVGTVVHGGYEFEHLAMQITSGWSDGHRSFNEDGDSTVYVDPVTKTLMFTPAPKLKAWQTNAAGIYARLKKADHTFATPANWVDDNKNSQASNFIVGLDAAVNEPALVNAAITKNKQVFISWIGNNWGDDKFIQMECGWNPNGVASGANGVSLRFHANGECEIWRNNFFLKKHKFSGGADNKEVEQTSGDVVAVLLIPCRERELLVLSNRGGGFNHVFEDIPEDEADPTITDAGKFWWFVPSGKPEVEVSFFGYPTTGFCCGIPTAFAEAPSAGQSAALTVDMDETVPGVTAAATFRLPDDSGAFVADGAAVDVRLRVDFTGDGSHTPFIYAGWGFYEPVYGHTDDSEAQELLDFTESARLEVAEHYCGTRLTTEHNSPDELDSEGSQFTIVSNRPHEAKIGANIILDGITNPVRLKDSIDDESRHIVLETRDKTKMLESYRFKERTPLDGSRLDDGFGTVLNSAHIPYSEQDIDDFGGYLIPSAGAASRGEFNAMIEVGDQASTWIERLHTDFCATAFVGFALFGNPSPAFSIIEPENLSEDNALDVYDTVAAAKADGVADSDLKNRVIRSFEQHKLEVEANDIFVTGMDRRYYRPIVYHYPDTASQDPTLAPSLRPDNWLGERRELAYVSPDLSTLDDCANCASKLFKRVTSRRVIGQFETGLLRDPDTNVPLWKGDCIRYHRALYGTAKLYRITSLSVDFQKEPRDDIWEWRECRYCAELIRENTSKGCGHKTTGTFAFQMLLDQVQKIISRKTVNFMTGTHVEQFLKRPPISVDFVA